uniref:Uncharacterized protein n=1 Tax=Oryza barthii TaxID=65489 RepID=A0A0D3EX19_9ORYZ
MWGSHKSYSPLSLSLRECGTVASGGGDLGGRSGGGGGDRARRGRLAVGRKKTGHENGRVLATLGLVTALSTTVLHALSAGHDAPVSAVLPPRPRTRKGRLCLATATRVGIPSKMAASGGGFSCTCDGGGVEGGRSGAGGEAPPPPMDAVGVLSQPTTRNHTRFSCWCRGIGKGRQDEDWLDCG